MTYCPVRTAGTTTPSAITPPFQSPLHTPCCVPGSVTWPGEAQSGCPVQSCGQGGGKETQSCSPDEEALGGRQLWARSPIRGTGFRAHLRGWPAGEGRWGGQADAGGRWRARRAGGRGALVDKDATERKARAAVVPAQLLPRAVEGERRLAEALLGERLALGAKAVLRTGEGFRAPRRPPRWRAGGGQVSSGVCAGVAPGILLHGCR
jgi:hypothetical protein